MKSYCLQTQPKSFYDSRKIRANREHQRRYLTGVRVKVRVMVNNGNLAPPCTCLPLASHISIHSQETKRAKRTSAIEISITA